MVKYLVNRKGASFRADEDNMQYIIEYLLKYNKENDYNSFWIMKEINDYINKGKDLRNEYWNENKKELIFKVRNTKGKLTNELAKKGYVVNFSSKKRSFSIYVKNDNFDLIRISNHPIARVVYKRGIGKNRFEKQVISKNSLISSKELSKSNIIIDNGIYELD